MNDKRAEKINDNIGLVHTVVNRFTGKGVDYDDLFQIGCIGLIKAVDKFDESKGFAFSTYAVPVIMGEIRQFFRDDSTVKISRSIKDTARKVSALREELTNLKGREPTVGEIAELSGLTKEEIAMAMNSVLPVFSLTPGDDDTKEEFDIPVESHDKDISDKIALLQVIDTLDEKDKMLIKCRYFDEMNQTKTAQIIGITQVQVSRREKKLLSILRSKLA